MFNSNLGLFFDLFIPNCPFMNTLAAISFSVGAKPIKPFDLSFSCLSLSFVLTCLSWNPHSSFVFLLQYSCRIVMSVNWLVYIIWPISLENSA